MLATACTDYQEVVDAEPILLTCADEFSVSGQGEDEFTISFSSRARVSITANCDWIKTPTGTFTEGNFTIKTTTNPTVEERKGVLTLTASDPAYGVSYSKTITVTQSEGYPTIEAYIEYPLWQKTFPANGYETKLYVKANATFSVITGATWIKFANGKTSYEGKGELGKYIEIDVIIAANPNTSSRNGNITISSEVGGNGYSCYVPVEQDAWKQTFSVYPKTKDVTYEYQSLKIYVSSNVSWKATCKYVYSYATDWIELDVDEFTATDKYSSESCNITLYIKENEDYSDRKAEIVFESKDGTEKYATFTITQAARAQLYFATKNIVVHNSAAQHSVQIRSDVNWTATSSDASWLEIVNPSGVGSSLEQNLYFKVSENTSGDARTAKINLWAATLGAVLTITQDGANTLYYSAPYKITSLTDEHFNTDFAKHTFDEAKGEGRVVFNIPLTTLLGQGENSYSVWQNATSITLPPTVTTIGDSAFRNCSSLSSINLPEGLTTIGEDAFYGCGNLDIDGIPSTVTEIGSSAFEGCEKLRKVVIPTGVSTIKDATFSGCWSLESVELPWHTMKIENHAFSGCKELVTIVNPEQIQQIGEYAFANCTSLKSIDISHAGTIGYAAFLGCSALTEATIATGVKVIDSYTFQNCTSLASITLPSSLTRVDEHAFEGCTSLKKVNISDIVAWCEVDFRGTYTPNTNPLSVANAALYLNGEEVTSINATDMGIEKFGYYCFSGCGSLQSVFVDRKEIQSNAFEGCPNLHSLSEAHVIGAYAFRNCKALRSISGLSGAQIRESAFEGCSELNSISHKVDSYTESIGKRAFYGCKKLATISLSDDKFANYIGESAFEGCISIKEIYVGTGSKASVVVDSKAFYGCTALQSVTFKYGANKITINERAFQGCTSLETLTIPSGLSSGGLHIGERAFYGCGKLTEVDLGAYIESIGTYAFYRSTGSLKVTCRVSDPPTGASQMFFTPTATMTLEIRVPSNSVNTYKAKLYWRDYANYIVGY